MTRETRANQDFLSRTRDTARWAREQIKRQIGMFAPTGPLLTSRPQNAAFYSQPDFPQYSLYY
jgi:importin subunit beta-1